MAAKAAETGGTPNSTPATGAGDGKTPETKTPAATPAAEAQGGEGQGGGEAKPNDGKAGDGKAADGKAGDKGSDGKGNEPAAAGKAPDKYELTIPKDSMVDADDLAQIEAVARENGWANEDAQNAVQHHADMLAEQAGRFEAILKADKTYGGDNLAETQRLANLALDKLRPATTEQGKAFRALLSKGGYGNHIGVVSLLADLGKMFAEDGHVGTKTATAEVDTADLMYGGSSKS